MKYLLGIVILCTVGYFGAKGYLHHKVGESVDTAVILVSPFVNIEYEGISSTLSGELTVDGIRATPSGFRDPIHVDRIGIDTPSFLSLLELADVMSNRGSGAPEPPDQIGLLVDGMRIATGSDVYRKLYELRLAALKVADQELPAARCVGKYGFSPAALTALGYDEQVFSGSFTFHTADSQYSMEVDAETRDMWQLDMELVLDGNMASEFAKGAAYRPALRSAELKYTDRSLNGRIEKYCASLGLSREETVQAHLDSLNWLGEVNGIAFDEYVLEPYLDFIRGKSTFVVTAEPNKPLRFSQLGLYNPKDVPALLNLRASAH